MAVPTQGDGPTLVAVPKDVWTKVAENVESGFVFIKNTDPEYLQTWKFTGDPAPTDRDEGVALDQPGQAINAIAAVDIYAYAISKDGRVRVDV